MVKGVRCVIVALLFITVMQGEDFAWPIPEGFRALTIRVPPKNENAEFFRVGNCVDVKVYANAHSTKIIALIRNVCILSIGMHIPVQRQTVTLLVSPQEAETLVMGSYKNTLWLEQPPPIFLPSFRLNPCLFDSGALKHIEGDFCDPFGMREFSMSIL
jgi:Flp pilus assembly protein RcpC/CpaB